ncbi:unnamed protein product [Chrysoparadoxa australica]
MRNSKVLPLSVDSPPRRFEILDDEAVPSLAQVLDGSVNVPPFDLEGFTAFAEAEFFAENLYFFAAVRTFQGSTDSASYGEEVSEIVNTYVKAGAEQEINLSSRVHKKVLEASDEAVKMWKEHGGPGQRDVFDDACSELLAMLERDGYERYTNMFLVRRQATRARTMALEWIHGRTNLQEFFSFPDRVLETDSRMHAICTFTLVTAAILHYYLTAGKGFPVFFIYLAYGHIARMLCGPRIDPQAFFVLFVAMPLATRLGYFKEAKISPGAPKRFTQGVGFFFSLLCIVWALLGWKLALYITAAMYEAATGLSAVAGICIGCIMYKQLRVIFGFKNCIECEMENMACPK